MREVGIAEAKKKLSSLLQAVERGEEIVIANRRRRAPLRSRSLVIAQSSDQQRQPSIAPVSPGKMSTAHWHPQPLIGRIPIRW